MLDKQQLRGLFSDPPATYRPQPFWFINHQLDPEELRRQIRMMHAQGVGGFVFHPRHGLGAPFMSAEWLAALAASCDEAHRLGMCVWLYDEDNWPSGTDGGRLTAAHPEYCMRYLRYWETRLAGPQEALIAPEVDDNSVLRILLAPLAKGANGLQPIIDRAQDCTSAWDAERGQVSLQVPPGEHVLSFFFICPVPQGVTFRNGSYLDTLDREACEEFVRRTYEPNLSVVAPYLGNTVEGIFTDEPGLMIHDGFFGSRAFRPTVADPQRRLPGTVMAWSRHFAEMFQDWRGYDLLDNLLALVYETSLHDIRVRQDYYQTATEAYLRHYYGAIRRFTQRHGLKLVGHTLEEPVWAQARSQGNQHLVLSQFDFPGYDYLAMQAGIATAQNPARLLAAQCAASIAALKGGERVVVEAFGGSGNGATLEQRRRHANFMALLGTSLFMPHGFYQSFAGERKSDWPPTEFYQAPFWEQYDYFSGYLGRISLAAHTGRPLLPLMVLSPIRTAYREIASDGRIQDSVRVDETFSSLSYDLLAMQRQHVYVDESHLIQGSLADGKLSFNDYLRDLQVLIVPDVSVLADETVPFLQRFLQAGGKILWLGRLPEVTTSGAPIAPETWAGTGSHLCVRYDSSAIRALLDAWQPLPITVASEQPGQVLANVKVLEEGGYLISVFNTSEDADGRATLQLGSGAWVIEELQAETGECVLWQRDGESSRLALTPSQLRLFLASPSDRIWESFIPREVTHIWQMAKATRFERLQPNVLPLDTWSLSLSIPYEQRQGLARWMAHCTMIRYSTTFDIGALPADAPGALALVLDDLPQYLPPHYGVLTGYRNYEITLNGVVLPPAHPVDYPDHYMTANDVDPYVRLGRNELSLYVVQSNERPPAPTLQYPPLLLARMALSPELAWLPDDPTPVGYWDVSGSPYYSGVGRYTFVIRLAEAVPKVMLDLGEVHESARIRVNGQVAATRGWAPYVLAVPADWRAGDNCVEIDVANTALNTWEKRPARSGMAGVLRFSVSGG